LGSLTLAKNVPILRQHLDLKYILFQSYTEDTLKYTVPFVCRILKEAKSSMVYTRHNPWFEGMLSILKEVKQGISAHNQAPARDQALVQEFDAFAHHFDFKFELIENSTFF
jgi:hypothetical protein